MRLIRCATFELEQFLGSIIPKYAILSHTWGNEEISFAEFKSDLDSVRSREGFSKISSSCAQALRDGLDYLWVDTCCIDKSSSSELSEAINSMFQWYKGSTICYAYLSDVTLNMFPITFPQSRWYRRGWTLQELLAPSKLVFYDQDWHGLGTKQDHAHWISRFTRIDVSALVGGMQHEDGSEAGLGVFCVAKRMSWASDRETTRVEDTAYCLLGILDVNMPLLYGEGYRAFIRLQEEIIKSCDDDSILAWGLDTEAEVALDDLKYAAESPPSFLMTNRVWDRADIEETLATSPKDFKNCHGLKYAAESPSPFLMTNLGLQIELPLVPIRALHTLSQRYKAGHIHGWIGLLTCGEPSDEYLLGIVLWPVERNNPTPGQFQRVQFGWPLSKQTVLVGARVAAQAVLSKITILQSNDRRSVRDYVFGTRQFIINQGGTLQKLGCDGYDISAAFATNVFNIPWTNGYFYKWNSVNKVLTASGNDNGFDLITISFQAQRSYLDTKFSVLIRGSRAIVRKGLSFSHLEQLQFSNFLDNKLQREDAEDIILACNDGKSYRIMVTVTEKKICSWKIMEVDIDAIRIER